MPSNEEIFLMASLFRGNDIDMDELEDPFVYMQENFNDMINEDAINEAYNNILIASEYNESTKHIIMFLIRNYVINYENNDQLNRYFRAASLNDAILFFTENELFGKTLINSYFKSFSKKENHYDENIDLFYKFTPVMLVGFLPNELRHAFRRFYDVLKCSADPYYTGSKMLEMILNDKAQISCSDEMRRDENLLKAHRNYLIRLMFSDVYADLIQNNLMDNYDQKIVQAVKYAINNDDYDLPMEDDEIDALFKCFFELCNNTEKRQNNNDILLRSNNKGI